MVQPIHPLDATRKLNEDYARYLRTIYFFRDEELRAQFQRALEAPDFLVRGPILEAAPPFRLGRSIGGLVEARSDVSAVELVAPADLARYDLTPKTLDVIHRAIAIGREAGWP